MKDLKTQEIAFSLLVDIIGMVLICILIQKQILYIAVKDGMLSLKFSGALLMKCFCQN